jgi:hypothetical protein
MTSAEALAYSSGTVLGTQIAAVQSLYHLGSQNGADSAFLLPVMSILQNLIALNEQFIAYDQSVTDFQAKCTALAKAGPPGGGVTPGMATLIGLGSAAAGGILGVVGATLWSKPKDEDEEEARQ